MATMERLLELGEVSILLLDGSFGLIIRWGDDEVGVQVPGEDGVRWLAAERIDFIGRDALVEIERYGLL